MLNVFALNRGEEQVLLTDDTVLPVVAWLNGEGDECDPVEAVVGIAGREGLWVTFSVADFDQGRLQ